MTENDEDQSCKDGKRRTEKCGAKITEVENAGVS